MSTAETITGLNAGYGVFLINTQAVGRVRLRREWQELLFGPVEMIAAATDEHAAAKAGVMYLAELDKIQDATRQAVVIRSRDSRENVALIEWVQRFSTYGNEYRYSRETWARDAIDAPKRAGRERRAMEA